MTNDSTGQKLKGVDRAFSIVRHIKQTGPTTVTELATGLGLPKSTAHIHLKTMAQAGYLFKEEDNKYRLSLDFLDHGAAARREFDIYDAAREEINSLANQTGEVSSVGVEERGQRVLLYKAEGGEALYDNANTGEFTNMHWTSLGKAMFAHLPAERKREIIDTHGLPSATEYTIIETDALYDEFERIRDNGYAIEDEEHRDSIRAVAVPIQSKNEIVGAIAVSGPKSRFSDRRIKTELVEILEKKADIIQLKLEHY